MIILDKKTKEQYIFFNPTIQIEENTQESEENSASQASTHNLQKKSELYYDRYCEPCRHTTL